MKKLFLTVAVILQGLIASAQFRVEVPDVVSVNEQFNVSFVYDGENSPVDFSWEPGPDFKLVWGPQKGQSTSVSIINGKRTKSSQFTYNYILMPKATGTFSIPSATVTLKGKGGTLKTDPVQVTVLKDDAGAGVSSSSSDNQQVVSSDISSDNLFLKLTLSKDKVVVGEPIIATLKLYQRVNIAGFEDVRFPSFNGFWNQEVQAPVNIEFRRESLGEKIYNAALLRKFVLIPQQAGTLKIDPAELVCLVNVRASSSGSVSIFDEFFNEYRTIRKRVVTPEYKVQVSALPSGAPSTFHGGVGEFSISARFSKDSISTHEAASLIVSLTGKGNVSLLEAPSISFPPDFEVYDIKVTEKTDKASGGTSGTKIFEFPFIPRSAGDFAIDPVKYTYYDIKTRKYVTVETPLLPFSVSKGSEQPSVSVPVAPSVSRQGVKNLNEDIRFIDIKSRKLFSKGSFFVGSALFYAISAMLILMAAALYFIFRFFASRRADVIGAKTRGATKMARRRLRKAEDFMKQNIHSAFYEELHKALVGYVSDKMNIQASELSKDNVAESLLASGADQASVDALLSIMDDCEFARYSPSSGSDAMAEHYKQAVDVISSLDSRMKNSRNSNRNNKSGKGKAAFVMAFMLLTINGFAADSYVDSLWTKACDSYSAGMWQDAAESFESISGMGLESASLYCNTGDAYFKMGDYSRAILYYEKALKLDPSYSDARYNLKVASDFVQDRIDPVPEFILKTWFRDICYILDSNTWASLALAFFALLLTCTLLFFLSHSSPVRKTGFFCGIVFLLLSVLTVTFSSWQKSEYMNKDSAIIMTPVISVKSSPSAETSTDLFILHEGTKVRIIDEVGGWRNIELADGRQGWMRSADMEII